MPCRHQSWTPNDLTRAQGPPPPLPPFPHAQFENHEHKTKKTPPWERPADLPGYIHFLLSDCIEKVRAKKENENQEKNKDGAA